MQFLQLLNGLVYRLMTFLWHFCIIVIQPIIDCARTLWNYSLPMCSRDTGLQCSVGQRFSNLQYFPVQIILMHWYFHNTTKVQTVVVTLGGYAPEWHQCLLLLLLLLRIRCSSSIKCFTNVVFTYLGTVYFYYLLFILWWSQLLTLHTVKPATRRPTLMANVKGHHVGQSC